MTKYICGVCRREVGRVFTTAVRTCLPVEGVLEDVHTFDHLDICEECLGEISVARMQAEVEAFSRLYRPPEYPDALEGALEELERLAEENGVLKEKIKILEDKENERTD